MNMARRRRRREGERRNCMQIYFYVGYTSIEEGGPILPSALGRSVGRSLGLNEQ